MKQPAEHDSLLGALGVLGGIVCAVGAGGKKSLLYAIAGQAPGRIGLTASVHTALFPSQLLTRKLIDTDQVLQARLPAMVGKGVTGFACPSPKPGRLAGLDPSRIRDLHEACRFDLCLVKADGARGRGIKAPNPDEPLLVPGCARVLAVISAGVLGRPLDDRSAHRAERLAPLVGAARGQTLGPKHLLALATSPHGSLQHSQGIALTVVINQIDDQALARELAPTARKILARAEAVDRVVFTCLRGGAQLMGLFTR